MPKYTDLSVDITNNLVPNGGFNEVKKGGMVTTEIKDESLVSEVTLNKMATSIPTPFARLFLYNTAFKELNKLEADDALQGKAYISNPGDSTLYHHLVAECLDMLEFIFEYGGDPLFTIHEWDAHTDIGLLGVKDTVDQVVKDDAIGFEEKENEIEKRHKKLGQALQGALSALNGVSKIFIFKYDNVIVGGTSPFTLVYTSPNWRRKMKNKFYGGRGNQLFGPVEKNTRVFSLFERSANFRFFLYSLQRHYSNAFSNNDSLRHFVDYLEKTRDRYERRNNQVFEGLAKYNKLIADGIANHFNDYFLPLKPTTTDTRGKDRRLAAEIVSVSGINFFTTVPQPDSESDYTIVPTVDDADLPVEKNAAGQLITMADKKPLVLSSRPLDNNPRYWFVTPYNPATLEARPEGEYFDRVLPGVPGNRRYAYLTESDILEDSIMFLGYNVNKKRFFTGFDGDCPFLLPIKPNFLKYFRVEDLEKMVKVIPEQPPLFPKVTVLVTVPVKGGQISFSRTYEKSKGQYVEFSKEGSFKLGVFPFYTYADEPTAAELDAYKVLLARMSDLSLEFYNRDFVTPLGDDVVKSRIRTQSHEHNNVTEYFTLGTHMEPNNPGKPGTFTTIRVIKNGIGGLIIPKFHKAQILGKKYVFCVDFGTANTNVAYAETSQQTVPDGSLQLMVEDRNICTLEFGCTGTDNKGTAACFDQMAMLNELGSEGKASDLNKYILSEFMPAEIGGADIKFPIRTIACLRSGTIDGDPQLFGDSNIAFYTDKYGNVKDYRYQTELKWGFNTRKLTGTFFRELIWMCKNKVAELGGAVDFDFYFTYPQTMYNPKQMMDSWAEAALAVRSLAKVVNTNTLTSSGRRLRVYEGIAPWYRAVSNPAEEIYSNEDFLNIDIGGGSTDVIYITKKRDSDGLLMSGFSFSAKFAAGDLWGDGVSLHARFTNGFLSVFENNVCPTLKKEIQDKYKEYKGRATNSADLIGFLFSHREFDMADLLTGDTWLKVPMLMHFAATIYYVARTLAMQQLPLPRHISFSGMGSLYLQYITGDSEILSEIIKSIFNFVGLRVVDKNGRDKSLTARFSPNPKKITAEGGLLMFNTTRPGLAAKVVESTELNFHLFDGEEDIEEEVEINCGNVDDYKKSAVQEVAKFLKLFDYKPFRQAVNSIDGAYPQFDLDRVRENLESGFELTKIKEYPNAIPDTIVKDVLFFWPLKHAIYLLARDMATQSININNAQKQNR